MEKNLYQQMRGTDADPPLLTRLSVAKEMAHINAAMANVLKVDDPPVFTPEEIRQVLYLSPDPGTDVLTQEVERQNETIASLDKSLATLADHLGVTLVNKGYGWEVKPQKQ